MTHYTDHTLIKMIQSGDALQWEKALEYLYVHDHYGIKGKIVRHVERSDGTTEDGEDVAHEAFIIAERKIRLGEFNNKCKLSTYITAIGKWYWWNQRRKKRPILMGLDLSTFTQIQESIEEHLQAMEYKVLIEKAIQTLPEQCREILFLKEQGYSNQEISTTLNHSNHKQTENRMFRCREALRGLIKNIKL